MTNFRNEIILKRSKWKRFLGWLNCFGPNMHDSETYHKMHEGGDAKSWDYKTCTDCGAVWKYYRGEDGQGFWERIK